MKPSTAVSMETLIDVDDFSERHLQFLDPHLDVANRPNILPLLSRPSSKSPISDEFKNFRVSLKWCALDHSSATGKLVSYAMFAAFTVIIPGGSILSVRIPAAAWAEDPFAFNKLVQLPESALAAIAFFTLSSFFHRYGLWQLLFLDGLRRDSAYVRRRYTGELNKAFRHLACILLPSFFMELAHKIIVFSTVTIAIPFSTQSAAAVNVPLNSVLFLLALVAWVYRTGVFLLVCMLFRVTCQLQILRFEDFRKALEEGPDSDPGRVFEEHKRIRKQLWTTSHRYRFFIIGGFVTITVSQLGALLMVLASRSEKSFFNSGDLVICSAVQLSGLFVCLIGAARITHRAQGIVSVATRWHMQMTSSTTAEAGRRKGLALLPPPANIESPPASPDGHCHTTDSDSSSEGFITTTSPPDTLSFKTRQALVTYLEHNHGGITLFGYSVDRGLLHTLFAFEFSLVLWILSKVVVLS